MPISATPIAALDPEPDGAEARLKLIYAKLLADPVLCHAVLFKRRHPNITPIFHHEMIRDWWSTEEWVIDIAFRGAAKSTTAEEAIAAMALFERYKYALIAGNSYDRACERLSSIKHELTTNETILEIFGDQRGETWNDGEIITERGVKIQALGARQSFRGAKHWDQRPDMLFIDDLEDEENVDTEQQRAKLMRWVTRSLLPACEPGARKRVAGTPLHPKAWLEAMRRAYPSRTKIYPIVLPAVSDPAQWRTSQWPDRYPLERIRQIRDDAERVGELQGFVQEYLCQSEEQALKPFQERHIQRAPTIPEWAPSLLIADPARTVNTRTSARTGYAVVSWIANKLYIRHAAGHFHMPDEIVGELFRLNNIFNPIHVGIEKDGLEQFLMQPLRSKMLDSGQVLPLWPLNAPRDRSKTNFIMGLQPFFEAGEILLCDEFPDLKTEILGFPTGRNDVLNCVAYALRMRAGRPVYEDFGVSNIAPDSLSPHQSQPVWLCLNVAPNHTTAVLCQYVNGCFRVFADWVKEGGVEDALGQLLPEAVQAAGNRPIKYFAPQDQFDQFNNLGLGRALLRFKIRDVMHGPRQDVSVGALATALRSRAIAQPAFLANKQARWTINALASGYARALDKSGILSDYPVPGYYATLMGGLESFARWLSVRVDEPEGGQAINWQRAADGRQFISSRVGRGGGQTALKR